MTIYTNKNIRIISLVLAASVASFFGYYSQNINSPHGDIVQAQTKQVNPTPLLTTDVRQVRKILPKQTPIINQSFRVNLEECGSCFFVPAIKSKRNLSIYLIKNNRIIYTFPQSEDLIPGWTLHQVKAVSFLQLGFSGPNEDGIMVLAEYITGIGRDGAKPFPVTIVYIREGKGFKILAKESEVLTSRRVKTVREAEQILLNEFNYLP